MDENNQPDSGQDLQNTEPAEQLSHSDAMTGVFTAPGETFETIVSTPKKTYWVIPVIISIIVGIIVSFLFMRDEQLISGMMDKQKAALEKRMEEQVKDGKMTNEQAKVAIENAEKFMDPKGVFFQVIGYGGAVVTPFLMLFILSLVYLIILKILKADFDFTNLLNVVGLSMLVTVAGAVVGLVLSIVLGEVSSLSLGLVFKDTVVGDKLHELLMKLDAFSIWYYILVAIGLSKVAKISQAKSYIIVFGVWIVWIIFTSGLSFLVG